MEIIKINLNNIEEDIVSRVIDVIKGGGVVVMPTDTIYGLVCDATNAEAVEKIFKIKNRNFSKPIGVFVVDIEMAHEYVKIENGQYRIKKFNY